MIITGIIGRGIVMRRLCMVFGLHFFVVTAVCADVIIDGDAAFESEVLACFEIIQGIGGRPARVLEGLQQSTREHVIQENEGLGSTTYSNPAGATGVGFGGTGVGSGSTIGWDPDFPWVYPDGVVRDYCSALYHEMSHAFVGDNGTRRGGIDPGSGIRRSEVGPNGATTMENEFRNAQGLEQRTVYGANPLPAGSIIP